MTHTISVLVENQFGVLTRVAGLFSARGFNIDSLAVGETDDPTVSRITIMTHGDDRIIEQIEKQLNKLIDVIKVQDLTKEERIERELVLVKVNANAGARPDLMQIVNTFRGKIVDVSQKTITVEVTGNESKVDAMLELLRPFGVREVVRTGSIAVSRKSELRATDDAEEKSEKPKAESKKTPSKSKKKKAAKI